MRSQDVGITAIHYESGIAATALTLFQSLDLERDKGSTAAYALLSLFSDGRWSTQGSIRGARRSDPVATSPLLGRWFSTMRSELALNLSATAQSGFMPAALLEGRARVLLDRGYRGAQAGAAVARSFDGTRWLTTVIGEAGTWMRSGNSLAAVTVAPMQLAVGDVLMDTQTEWQWGSDQRYVSTVAGIRLGEAQRGTVAWLSLAAGFRILDTWASVSLGSYPADLVQGLPGGRFFGVTLRVPPARPRAAPAVRPAPRRIDEDLLLDIARPLDLVVSPPLDSTGIREVRVWAPGAERVEILADFVDWIPVPLERKANGEWRGYYRIGPGLHRINVRLDGWRVEVPPRLAVVEDEFAGKVGVIIVR
jgi:hypothetical protein